MPTVLPIVNPDRAHVPYIIVTNSGAQRFDLFKGPFTRNDQCLSFCSPRSLDASPNSVLFAIVIVSPFSDNFWYLTVPYGIGRQVLDELLKIGAFSTNPGPEEKSSMSGAEVAESQSQEGWKKWRMRQWEKYQMMEMRTAAWRHLPLGYVTYDVSPPHIFFSPRPSNPEYVSTLKTCPGSGDDTRHQAIPYHEAPGYVSSNTIPRKMSSDALHDLVFNGFFRPDVIKVVNELRVSGGFESWLGRNVTMKDVMPYGEIKANEVFGIFAKEKWN